ncbi:hypothetical protein RJ641_006203 [Dillenia turbinata]|uniref:Retrovirus-related Pol polyprotein from transposon TNT 1-94-like beta-barrel domain-containing protein n=1 Tax=Dillenia turbinata TaxID=194707 RepID=A0AAN8VHP5_9MAGN
MKLCCSTAIRSETQQQELLSSYNILCHLVPYARRRLGLSTLRIFLNRASNSYNHHQNLCMNSVFDRLKSGLEETLSAWNIALSLNPDLFQPEFLRYAFGCRAEGVGPVAIQTKHGIKKIQEILYVPDANTNLLSLGQLLEHGLDIRSKLGSPLPRGFSSNACLLACVSMAGELEVESHEAIIEKIKEAKNSITNEYVRGYTEAIDAPQPTLPPLKELTVGEYINFYFTTLSYDSTTTE